MVLTNGVKAERFVLHHGGVEHHGDPAPVSLMAPNGVTAAGHHAPHLAQQIGRAERKTPAGAEQAVQAFEVDCGVFLRHHHIKRVLLVA